MMHSPCQEWDNNMVYHIHIKNGIQVYIWIFQLKLAMASM